MDGLSIITGICMMVFLLFYLAFNLNDKENKFMTIAKVFLIVFALFLLAYVPSTMKVLDRDCGILSDGSYVCFNSNGTAVSDYGVGTSEISGGLVSTYYTFLYMMYFFVFVGMLYFGGKIVTEWWKKRKLV